MVPLAGGLGDGDQSEEKLMLSVTAYLSGRSPGAPRCSARAPCYGFMVYCDLEENHEGDHFDRRRCVSWNGVPICEECGQEEAQSWLEVRPGKRPRLGCWACVREAVATRPGRRGPPRAGEQRKEQDVTRVTTEKCLLGGRVSHRWTDQVGTTDETSEPRRRAPAADDYGREPEDDVPERARTLDLVELLEKGKR